MRHRPPFPTALLLAACTTLFGASASPGVSYAKNVYVIVVGDTSRAAGLGSDIEQDMALMVSAFRGNIPRQMLHVEKIAGEQLSRQAVLNSIGRLQVTSDDAIVFYYSGHGKWDGAQQQHVLTFPRTREELFREEVRLAMIRRRPRAAILITDCCAGGRVAQTTVQPPKDLRFPDRASPLFERLFLDYSGVISISSSQPGEISLTRGDGNGSLFTFPFVNVLLDNAPATLGWNTIIEKTAVLVQRDFERVTDGKGIKVDRDGDGTKESVQKNQTVHAYVNTPRLGMRAALRDEGMVILEVMELSPAFRARLEVGDQLLEINGQPVRSEQEYSDAVDNSPRQMRMKVRDHRTGRVFDIEAELNTQ